MWLNIIYPPYFPWFFGCGLIKRPFFDPPRWYLILQVSLLINEHKLRRKKEYRLFRFNVSWISKFEFVSCVLIGWKFVVYFFQPIRSQLIHLDSKNGGLHEKRERTTENKAGKLCSVTFPKKKDVHIPGIYQGLIITLATKCQIC